MVARVRAAGGTFFAKLRTDPTDAAVCERWALELLARARDVEAPGLVWASSVRGVVATVAAGADASAARAPRRIDVPGGAVLVMTAVPGVERAVLDEDALAAAARALAALHRVRVKDGPPLMGGVAAPSMVRFTERCLELLAAEQVLSARDHSALRALVKAAGRAVADHWWDLDDDTPRALCHGDVRARNLLFSGRGSGTRAALIDFELAGIADPLIDLVRFTSFAALSRHQELCLLDAYCEATRADRLDRYFLYRPIAAAFSALSAASHYAAAAAGRRRAAPGWLATRRPQVEAQLSALLERPVKLERSRRRAFSGVIAIDGAAGSGKSPLARALARRLRVPHVGTGLAYRAATLLALEHGLDPERPADLARLLRLLARTPMVLTDDGGIAVDGVPLFASLDTLPVEERVAAWARLPDVRRALRPVLDAAVQVRAAVVEGRDVKTVLRPDAVASFYVDVDERVRASLVRGRAGADSKRLVAAMRARDRIDRTRAAAPALVPKGAVRVRVAGDVEALADRLARRLRGSGGRG
ncbi:MAG: (d)CMP kinase [Deltaproteobacteria bacterium]|nr:(d)CMP kinase [Deltaproteobacteria bacterium]